MNHKHWEELLDCHPGLSEDVTALWQLMNWFTCHTLTNLLGDHLTPQKIHSLDCNDFVRKWGERVFVSFKLGKVEADLSSVQMNDEMCSGFGLDFSSCTLSVCYFMVTMLVSRRKIKTRQPSIWLLWRPKNYLFLALHLSSVCWCMVNRDVGKTALAREISRVIKALDTNTCGGRFGF